MTWVIQADGIVVFLYFHWDNFFFRLLNGSCLLVVLRVPTLVVRLRDQLVQVQPPLLEDVAQPLLVVLDEVVCEAQLPQVIAVRDDPVDVLVKQTAPEPGVRGIVLPHRHWGVTTS